MEDGRQHFPQWPWWHRRHHHRHVRPFLVIRGIAIELEPEETLLMALNMTVGQTDGLTIAFLDQNGQPMATTPTPDSPPVWTASTPATDTLAIAADGLSAVDTAVGAGTDTVTLAVVVGGVTFNAQLDVNVTAPAPPAQVLTNVAIVAGTPTP